MFPFEHRIALFGFFVGTKNQIEQIKKTKLQVETRLKETQIKESISWAKYQTVIKNSWHLVDVQQSILYCVKERPKLKNHQHINFANCPCNISFCVGVKSVFCNRNVNKTNKICRDETYRQCITKKKQNTHTKSKFRSCECAYVMYFTTVLTPCVFCFSFAIHWWYICR